MLSLKQQPLVKPHLQDFKSEACLIFVRDTDKLQEKVQQTIPTGRKKKKGHQDWSVFTDRVAFRTQWQ